MALAGNHTEYFSMLERTHSLDDVNVFLNMFSQESLAYPRKQMLQKDFACSYHLVTKWVVCCGKVTI